jgi:hypothetical protein
MLAGQVCLHHAPETQRRSCCLAQAARDSAPGGTRWHGHQWRYQRRRCPNQTAGRKPMSGLHLNSTSDSCSVTGTFGELQVTERCKHVVLDVRSRNYDTTGHLHYEHALARLPLQKALQLRDLLDRAIEASRVTIATAQPGLWSNSAIASVAGELLRRRQA